MRYKKGQSGNPAGRPKGSKSDFSRTALEEAIAFVEEKKKVSIFQHFVERALKNDTVLIALMKKLISDKDPKDAENDIDWSQFKLVIPGVDDMKPEKLEELKLKYLLQ